MPKNSVADWSTTAADNTDIGGINIAEGSLAGLLNNALRELMKQIRSKVTTGEVDAPTHRVDANYFLGLLGGNPIINADANKYLVLDRATNRWSYQIPGAGYTLVYDTDVGQTYAGARVNADGTTSGAWGLASVSRTGTGVYEITTTSAATAFVVHITPLSTVGGGSPPGGIVWSIGIASNVVTATFRDGSNSNTTIDRAFHITFTRSA